MNIGSPGEDGTIVWNTDAGSDTDDVSVNVQAGTLKAGDSPFSSILDTFADSVMGTNVETGAAIDVAGQGTNINDLLGAGTVTNRGGPATIALFGALVGAANFSGAISGPLSVVFNGNASLSGLEDYTGSATLVNGTSLTNSGTYDLVADTNVSGASTNSFVNDSVGLFEKTGGGGVSDATTEFVNNGTLNVLSGSIVFSGGFTNAGVIHGLVTQSKLVPIGELHDVIVSAPVASDFNGDTRSDILWQNAERSGLDLGYEREHPNRRRGREPQPRIELESHRNRRLQRRRPCRYPVAERRRSGFDLGHERQRP